MAKQSTPAKDQVTNDTNNVPQATPQATQDTANATPAQEPTSEKLTSLKAQLSDITQAFKMSEFGTPEADKLLADIVAKKKEIDVEKSNIIRHENELKIAEHRAAIIQKLDAAITLALAVRELPQDAPQEVKDAKIADAKTAYDEVANMLTGKLPKVATNNGTPTTGTRGNTTQAIKDEYAAILAANPNIAYKDAREMIEAKGYARGTVGAATLEYRRENNLP